MANKKTNRTSVSHNMESSDEMLKLVKIILILIVIVVLFYGITVLLTKYKKNRENNYASSSTPAVIQYDEILLGTLLTQNAEEYYVLIEKENSPYNDLFDTYLKSYKSKENAMKVYTANLDSVFNHYYVADISVLNTNDMSKFKVSDVTLVKIKNKMIVETYEGVDNIENALKNLIK